MTVYIEKPPINLRETLTRLDGQRAPRRQTFQFSGNGVTTVFTLPVGWAPFAVYSAGLRRRAGAGNDYAVTFDGFRSYVTFAVAPGAVFVEIDADEVLA